MIVGAILTLHSRMGRDGCCIMKRRIRCSFLKANIFDFIHGSWQISGAQS